MGGGADCLKQSRSDIERRKCRESERSISLAGGVCKTCHRLSLGLWLVIVALLTSLSFVTKTNTIFSLCNICQRLSSFCLNHCRLAGFSCFRHENKHTFLSLRHLPKSVFGFCLNHCLRAYCILSSRKQTHFSACLGQSIK